MKNKIYIETSVVSYYVAERSENIRIAGHQLSTIDMWKQLSKFDVYISDIVLDEISKGTIEQSQVRLNAVEGFNILDFDKKTKELSDLLLAKKAIPKKCPEDALHIAITAVNNVDFIVTWNFKHINNPFMKDKIREIIKGAGYKSPIMCSSEELIGENDNVWPNCSRSP